MPCDSGPRNHRLPKCRAEAGLRQDGHASAPMAAACTWPGHLGLAPLHSRPPLPSLAGDQARPLVTHTAPRGTNAILAPDQPIRKSRWGVLARKQACVHPGDPEPLKPLTQACRGLVLAAAAAKSHAHQAQSQSPLASDPQGPTAQRGALMARGSLPTQTPRNRGEGAVRAPVRPPPIQAGRAGSFLSLQVRTGRNRRHPPGPVHSPLLEVQEDLGQRAAACHHGHIDSPQEAVMHLNQVLG